MLNARPYSLPQRDFHSSVAVDLTGLFMDFLNSLNQKQFFGFFLDMRSSLFVKCARQYIQTSAHYLYRIPFPICIDDPIQSFSRPHLFRSSRNFFIKVTSISSRSIFYLSVSGFDDGRPCFLFRDSTSPVALYCRTYVIICVSLLSPFSRNAFFASSSSRRRHTTSFRKAKRYLFIPTFPAIFNNTSCGFYFTTGGIFFLIYFFWGQFSGECLFVLIVFFASSATQFLTTFPEGAALVIQNSF